MTISILIGTRNRPGTLVRCLERIAAQQYPHVEVLVLDDASHPAVDPAELQRALRGRYPLRVFRNTEQQHLARVRNQLLAESTGEVCCILDDDAYLETPDALDHIVAAFSSDPGVGIVAFYIRDFRSGDERPLTPHTRRQVRRDPSLLGRPHRVSYFLGCAHALRRTVIERCGGFDEVFVYGLDEIELGYRALEAGFQIQYEPAVQVGHAPPVGKKERDPWRLYYLTRNRILFAYKHLPLRYVVPYVGGWLGWYAWRAFCEATPGAFLRGVVGGFQQINRLVRGPVTSGTVSYLKTYYGRLWR